MAVWEYDIGLATHDSLREGWTVHHWTRVVVVADTELDARLMACQVAACGGWMPTVALLRL